VEQVLVGRRGLGRVRGKGVARWIQCNKMFTHVSKLKTTPVETTPGIVGRGDEGEWLRGWIHVWSTWYIVRTCVNATMYPHPSQ
jgi:hypothetical protein